MSRIPGSNDPGYITDEALSQFQHDIMTGFDGAAQWRRDCTCEHAQVEHKVGGCTRCRCQRFKVGEHERLDLWLHPQAAKWLPEWVHVEATGNRYDVNGFIQFRLVRDWDSAAVKVVRSGVRELTLRPEGE